MRPVRAPSRPPWGRRGRAGVDLDGEEDVTLAEDAGRRKRPPAEGSNVRFAHEEAELLAELAHRGGDRLLARLDEPRGQLPERAAVGGRDGAKRKARPNRGAQEHVPDAADREVRRQHDRVERLARSEVVGERRALGPVGVMRDEVEAHDVEETAGRARALRAVSGDDEPNVGQGRKR